MTKKVKNFEFIEKYIRKMTFGILTTVDKNGIPHSTGMLYGVSPPGAKFCLYCITEDNYKKVRNIKENPHVAFAIPYPHHLLRFVPSSCIQFSGTAELKPSDDSEGRNAFSANTILKSNLKEVDKGEIPIDKVVFIKIKPEKKIFCYGVGISLMKLARDHGSGMYSVEIPPERL